MYQHRNLKFAASRIKSHVIVINDVNLYRRMNCRIFYVIQTDVAVTKGSACLGHKNDIDCRRLEVLSIKEDELKM